jgi:hypothetical protein
MFSSIVGACADPGTTCACAMPWLRCDCVGAICTGGVVVVVVVVPGTCCQGVAGALDLDLDFGTCCHAVVVVVGAAAALDVGTVAVVVWVVDVDGRCQGNVGAAAAAAGFCQLFLDSFGAAVAVVVVEVIVGTRAGSSPTL